MFQTITHLLVEASKQNATVPSVQIYQIEGKTFRIRDKCNLSCRESIGLIYIFPSLPPTRSVVKIGFLMWRRLQVLVQRRKLLWRRERGMDWQGWAADNSQFDSIRPRWVLKGPIPSLFFQSYAGLAEMFCENCLTMSLGWKIWNRYFVLCLS